MGKKRFSILDLIKSWATALAWEVFLWGIGKTDEEYWEEITAQEVALASNGQVFQICQDGDFFFVARYDFVDMQESTYIPVSRAVVEDLIASNALGKEQEVFFLEVLDELRECPGENERRL
jgi:hypothetical protein